ncbi:MAG: D-2-hydroxyacid dehydrogenase [Spirochaetia bacterium]
MSLGTGRSADCMSGGRPVEDIVALDAYGVNPGDLSWEPFERMGHLTVYDHCSPETIVERAGNASILLVDMCAISDDVLSRLPNLRYIGLFATGHDQVDTEAARRRGIAVANVPEYSTPSVAQMTFALLLNLTNHVAGYSDYVARGNWRADREFRYIEGPLIELSGKTMGILGVGQIGAAAARIARAFGMQVLAWSRRRKDVDGIEIEWVELDEVFRRSDVVSLHLPLTAETAGIVDARRLSLMKPGAFLVNTARGGLVVDEALAAALHEGRIAGAALDVLGPTEPPEPDNPLLSAPNCRITPHVAWATRAARERCLRTAAENLESFLHGGSQNRIV